MLRGSHRLLQINVHKYILQSPHTWYDLSLCDHLDSVNHRYIYINNWIADRLTAKQPASEATE